MREHKENALNNLLLKKISVSLKSCCVLKKLKEYLIVIKRSSLARINLPLEARTKSDAVRDRKVSACIGPMQPAEAPSTPSPLHLLPQPLAFSVHQQPTVQV